MQATTKPSGDPELDEAIYSMTLDECERGWLRGPFSPEMLDKRHGKVWTAARRFGLRQGTEKIRAIDDYSEHGQNATVTCDEKVPLSGVDAIVSIMKVMASAVKDDRSVEVLGLKGVLHESWTVQEARTILGRCVDLKSAYRQLVRRRADAHICIIAV